MSTAADDDWAPLWENRGSMVIPAEDFDRLVAILDAAEGK